MQKFDYMGFTFKPYANVIGSGEAGYRRSMDIANTSIYAKPLLSTADGYTHEDFYKAAGDNAVDIYYLDGAERNMFGEIRNFYIPIGSGIVPANVNAETRKYIKEIA